MRISEVLPISVRIIPVISCLVSVCFGVNMTALDEEMRRSVIQTLKEDGFDPVCEGTYFQTVGPRFETKAEIRLYKDYFEVVGMTGASEATLSQELGIPFCMVGIIDNMCHGLGAPLSIEVEIAVNCKVVLQCSARQEFSAI